MSISPHPEAVLHGGLVSGRVVRVGDTVRRVAGPWTPTIQALLAHLNTRGFPAPHPLGLDEQGREVVSFLQGRCSTWPWPPPLLASDGARQVGALLRRCHAAAADFAPPSPARWRHGEQTPRPGEIVLHGDFGPHNLIWSDTLLVGVIDFELARPGDPSEDAGFAVIRAAQLRPDKMTRPVGYDTPPDRRARLAAFAEGYRTSPALLVSAALSAQRSEIARIDRLGGAGVEPWATFLRRGLGEQARLELTWLEANAGACA
ncbi:MAG TPA: aminoglycoside phosphotransferase family protein [Caulobacteraceae bacterium]|nr:aminoglycoside phosphotransferase family protein [Caulobacteraceae bacterium]